VAKEKAVKCPKCGEKENVISFTIPLKGGKEIEVVWCRSCENVEEMKGVEDAE